MLNLDMCIDLLVPCNEKDKLVMTLVIVGKVVVEVVIVVVVVDLGEEINVSGLVVR